MYITVSTCSVGPETLVFSALSGICPTQRFWSGRSIQPTFFFFFFTAVFKFILVYNFRPVMESVSHSVCCLQPLSSFFCSFWCFQVLAIAKEKVKQQTEKDAIVILPSILLKSLQFILLFCQGRLQIQIASIMGQLEGAVIRLSMQPHTHT